MNNISKRARNTLREAVEEVKTKGARDIPLPPDTILALLDMIDNEESNLKENLTSSISEQIDHPAASGDVPDASQEWAKLDGATAFHLIERHAEDWVETGRMMESWLAARQAAAAHQQQEPVVWRCHYCGASTAETCDAVGCHGHQEGKPAQPPQPSQDAVDAPAIAEALKSAVSAIYFDDSSDYRSSLWDVVRSLNPAIAELLEENPSAAYHQADAAAMRSNISGGE